MQALFFPFLLIQVTRVDIDHYSQNGNSSMINLRRTWLVFCVTFPPTVQRSGEVESIIARRCV